MSRYINKYTNQSAIQDALDSGSLSKPYVAYNEGQQTLDYNSLSSYAGEYFTVEALQSGYFYWNNASNLYYSLNNGAWTALVEGIEVNTGDKIRLYGTNSAYNTFTFRPEYIYKVYGNIMSLLYGQNFIGQTIIESLSTFRNLFSRVMPANLMDCSNLILPATTLTSGCYASMFNGCENITKAPTLPATTLANQCYYTMFTNCTNLNYIKCLATSDVGGSWMTDWLSGVASTGTFVKASGVSWPVGTGGIPSGWTVVEV